MSDQARLVAERIAKQVGTSAPDVGKTVNGDKTDLGSELAAMRATLDQLQQKLVQIEAKVGSSVRSASIAGSAGIGSTGVVGSAGVSTTPRVHSPWLAGVNADHPSTERFGVEEATVSELVDFFQNEKACSLEPGGKPCDHCAMCSSRGF